MPLESITVEGGLFPPDLLQRLAQGEAADQRPRDFQLSPSVRLADETQAAFSDMRSFWDAWGRRADPDAVVREAFVEPLLERLGFRGIHFQRANIEAGGASFDIHRRTHDAEDATPVHIVRADAELDGRGERRRSPAAELQDLLNRSEAVWGILANGPQVRILRDSAGRSRRAWLQFDLKAMIEENAYADFALLYRLLHRTRFPWPEAPAHECPLERLYQQGVEEGGRVRDKLRDGVKRALETLGRALLRREGNEALRDALAGGGFGAAEFYRELLNFVYRLLFLMVTEERKLLAGGGEPGKYEIFARHYGIGRLRERADRQREADDYADLWIGLRQTFRVCRDEDAAAAVGLSPLNGELFGERACRQIERAECPNEALLDAVGYLSNYRAEDGRLRRVNYAHLDVEELGSVYESLLDYAPRISGDRRGFHLAAGSERKQTGSYYTPPELVRELVDSALVPVMQERLDAAATRADKERALLDLRVCDPAAGSGHFLLAAARRIGDQLAEIRAAPAVPDERERREARRDVVQQCIYAVDKNPLAVDLCKVALWIEAHAAGFPLSFLDHHVKHGDSLVGVLDLGVLEEGIPDGAYNPVAGDEKPAANSYKKRNREERKGQLSLGGDWDQARWEEVAATFARLGSRRQGTTSEVKAIEATYAQMREEGTLLHNLRVACDTWTYAFFAPLQEPQADGLDRVPAHNHLRTAFADRILHPILFREAEAAGKQHPYFHWPIEFPDITDKGGFDVVLGNPPWEQIQLDPREFFATRDVEIANQPNMAARDRAIARLETGDPDLHREYFDAVDEMKRGQKFIHKSGRFDLTSRGRLNSAPLFAEHARSLVGSFGRAGLLVPSGLATDSFTQHFFADLVESRAIASLFDFENREGIFPGVHRSYKFTLLTVSGSGQPNDEADFAFYLRRTDQLQDDERRVPLSRADFALFNPNTRTCPIFRARRDMAVARKMYERAGVFVDERADSNPWGLKLQLMFMMNSDSGLFRTRADLVSDEWELTGNIFERGEDRYLPLIEAKLIHQYDHRFASFDRSSGTDVGKWQAKQVDEIDKQYPDLVALPRYWVPEDEVLSRLNRVAAAEPDSGGGGAGFGRRRSRIRAASAVRRSPRWRANRSPRHRSGDGSPNRDRSHDSAIRSRGEREDRGNWLVAFRNIASPTNRRTVIAGVFPMTGTNEGLPLLHIDAAAWLHVFRDVTHPTNERTVIASQVPESGAGHSAPLMDFEEAREVASACVLANMNSIPLDWAARLSVGGTHLSFFIVKQLPILPPEAYIEESGAGAAWVELVVPRVLELTYTAWDLQGFAEDLGYEGEPFVWDEERRHKLKSELDAIYAHMYGLERDEIEWILEPEEPSVSFPALQRSEEKQFGEYRTKRYVLHAYDQLSRGEPPDLSALPADIRPVNRD